MRFLLIILLFGGSALAEVPDAPSAARKENIFVAPFKHTEFYVGVGVFSASAIADVHSTKVCEHTKPPQCAEAYPGHDTYSYITPLIALVGGMTYGCEIMLTDHKWYRRFICPAIGIGFSYQHWKDASTIYKTDYRARP